MRKAVEWKGWWVVTNSTKERFIAGPFKEEDRARMLAYRMSECCGFLLQQNGYRVVPATLKEVLKPRKRA